MTKHRDRILLPDLGSPSEHASAGNSLPEAAQLRPPAVDNANGALSRRASARERNRLIPKQVARTLLSKATSAHYVGSRRAQPLQETDHLLDVNEAAAMLCIAPATLRNWAYQRRIAKVNLGGPRGVLRFRVSDLQRFIRAGLQAPIATRRLVTTTTDGAS